MHTSSLHSLLDKAIPFHLENYHKRKVVRQHQRPIAFILLIYIHIYIYLWYSYDVLKKVIRKLLKDYYRLVKGYKLNMILKRSNIHKAFMFQDVSTSWIYIGRHFTVITFLKVIESSSFSLCLENTFAPKHKFKTRHDHLKLRAYIGGFGQCGWINTYTLLHWRML